MASPFIAPYQSTHSQARIVVLLLAAGGAIRFLILPLQVLAIFGVGIQSADLSDNLTTSVLILLRVLLSLLAGLIQIGTIVVFLVWLYRACLNLPAFGANRHHIAYSPGWAVGSFFVPFVNLVVPYRAVRELWQKSEVEPDSLPLPVSPPGFFPAWWGFWIVSSVIGNVYLRMTVATAPQEMTATAGILTEVLAITAAAFAIMVVREIDRRQEEASRNLPPSRGLPTPPPPPLFQSDSNTAPEQQPAQ